MEKGKLFKGILGIFVMLAIIVMLPLTSDAQSAEKPIMLKFAHMNPETSYGTQHGIYAWLDKIEKATKGRVKITRYGAQTLVKGTDTWEAVKTGIADMGWCPHGYWPGMTPLSEVITLPALPLRTGGQTASIMWQIYENFPEIQKEFKGVKMVAFPCCYPYGLVMSKKLVKTPQDLKGMKIKVLSGPSVDQMKALGAIPVVMPFPEVYMSLQKGILDGCAIPYEVLYGWKIAEVAKYVTILPLTATLHSIPMNLKKWNSLPPDIQKEIMSVSGLEGSKFVSGQYWDKAGELSFENCKKAGIELVIHKPSDEELKRFEEIGGKPVWKTWTEKMETKGYTGAKKIIDEILRLSKEN
jgi:TRAP-type C4-dicarboxylate transport system substrate-binding protein